MKVAVVSKDGLISEAYGETSEVVIFEIDRAHEIVNMEHIPVEGKGHLPVAGIMITNQVQGVICDGISKPAFDMMKNMRAHVFANVKGDPEEAVRKLLRRELTELKAVDCDFSEEPAECSGNCSSCAYH